MGNINIFQFDVKHQIIDRLFFSLQSPGHPGSECTLISLSHYLFVLKYWKLYKSEAVMLFTRSQLVFKSWITTEMSASNLQAISQGSARGPILYARRTYTHRAITIMPINGKCQEARGQLASPNQIFLQNSYQET